MRAAFQRDTLTELFPPHIIANLHDKWTFVHFIVAEDWRSNTDSTCYLRYMNIQGQADYWLFSAFIFSNMYVQKNSNFSKSNLKDFFRIRTLLRQMSF